MTQAFIFQQLARCLKIFQISQNNFQLKITLDDGFRDKKDIWLKVLTGLLMLICIYPLDYRKTI
ncbi:MAG TPA: hypothetical protein DD706_14630 [Nitrospiraceae bacterium]|nr:hypothetical protein [Nitrospiraceae bacterium]